MLTILDEIEEQNRVAIRWNLKTTHEKDFAGMAASQKKIEIEGTDGFSLLPVAIILISNLYK